MAHSLARLLAVHDVLKDEMGPAITHLTETLRECDTNISSLRREWPVAGLSVRVTRKQAMVFVRDPEDTGVMEELHLSGFSFCRADRAMV